MNVSKNCLNRVSAYVPRHVRLGLCCFSHPLDLRQDVIDDIPIVDDRGSVVKTVSKIKSVPASELMSKYKCSAFSLSALVKAGVPLKVVNINSSSAATIDKLEQICVQLDSADAFVNKVMAQKLERESWFKDPDEAPVDTTEFKEIY